MPTSTFNIAASGDDAYVEKSQASVYPPGGSVTRNTTGTTVVATRQFATPYYMIDNGLLKWDTSSLPDTAIITSAILRAYAVSKVNTDSLSLTAGWYGWSGVDSDHSAVPETNALSGVALSGITTSADNDFTLSGLSNINTTGTTYLRLHISQRSADANPTGLNQVLFASYDHTTLTEPRLIVTYSTDVGGDLVGQIGV